MRKVLSGALNAKWWNYVVEAAGRSFNKSEDFQLLFNAITADIKQREKENNTQTLFPIQIQRAICCSLIFRKDSEKSLDYQTAKFFAKHALRRLKQEERKDNFKQAYFQLIRLLLYLLRCRRSNPSCFDHNDKSEIKPFIKAIESMRKAISHLRYRQAARAQKVQQILDGFEKYLYYEGSEETLIELNELAGET